MRAAHLPVSMVLVKIGGKQEEQDSENLMKRSE
jgi:hypothetical protein